MFEYIILMANFKLNKQINQQSEAFRRGLHEIIAPEWLKMFNQVIKH